MEFTFPIATLHIYELYTNSVVMFACFRVSCTVFQGLGGKYNYNNNLNSPSEDSSSACVRTWQLFLLFTQRGAGVCRPQAAYVCSLRHSNLTLLLTFLKLSRKEQLRSLNLEPHNSLTRNI